MQHLLAIEAIAKESGRNVTEVAAEYRAIMAAHGITSSLAGGHYGIKGNKAINNKPVAEAGKGEIQQAGKVPEATTNKVTAGKGTNTIKPTVTAELEVNGHKFIDTNQTARPADKANSNESTLISDKIKSKEEKLINKGKTDNLPLPNSNMANAHAEIGAIHQAHKAGLAEGADMKLTVSGKPVCGYCRGDIAAAAKQAGVKSLTIYEEKTGKTLYWKQGMRTLREQE